MSVFRSPKDHWDSSIKLHDIYNKIRMNFKSMYFVLV